MASASEATEASQLRFAVAGETYALPASIVMEILRPRPLARVPHAPPSLLGIINLRGDIVPIVSAARLLGREQGEATKASRVVMIDHEPRVGLLVDAVDGLARSQTAPLFDVAALLASAVPTKQARRRRREIGDAMPAASDGPAGQQESARELLGFIVAGQSYALPLDTVVEVLPEGQALTRVADSDPAMLGVVAHRGTLLPVIALGRLLGHAVADDGPVVLVRLAHGTVGLAVGTLQAISRVPLAALDEVPAVLTRGTGETRVDRIARGPDGALTAILSPAKLFDETTQARLVALAGEDLQTMEATAKEEDSERFLVFHLADEVYGLPIASVDEVVRHPGALTRLPRGPAFVLGVMSLRGKPVPVIDSRSRFGAADAGQIGDRIVVLTVDGLQAGFCVDAVTEILEVAASAVVEAPDVGGEAGKAFHRIIEHDGRLVFVIEPGALLKKAEREALAKAARRPAGDTAIGAPPGPAARA